MTNLEIQNAYMGVDQVDKVYLGTDVIYEASGQSHDYSTDYFTFAIISGGVISYRTTQNAWAPVIAYSINEGPWVALTATTTQQTINVNAGDEVRMKGTNITFSKNGGAQNATFATGTTCIYNLQGNIMSLLYGDNFIGQTSLIPLPNTTYFGYVFYSLFRNTSVVDASNLIIPVLSLSGTTGYEYEHAYQSMFRDCTMLTKAPELPATVARTDSYASMFSGCTNLNYVRCLLESPDTTITENWLAGVAATGTFIKHPNATWSTGGSGIPAGWTVEDAVI